MKHAHPTAAPDDAQTAYRWAKLAEVATDLAKNPNDAWNNLRAAEIAAFLLYDADDLMDWARDELRIDSEGYPLTGEGDRNYCADRKYIPFEVEDARHQLEPMAFARSTFGMGVGS